MLSSLKSSKLKSKQKRGKPKTTTLLLQSQSICRSKTRIKNWLSINSPKWSITSKLKTFCVKECSRKRRVLLLVPNSLGKSMLRSVKNMPTSCTMLRKNTTKPLCNTWKQLGTWTPVMWSRGTLKFNSFLTWSSIWKDWLIHPLSQLIQLKIWAQLKITTRITLPCF